MSKKILTVASPSTKIFTAFLPANMLTIFLLGFSSGLPFLLLLSTLSVWLTEAGITKTEIGMFAWITISYAGKFLLAPMLDNIKLPVLFAKFGQRRSWILLAQICLALALWLLGHTDPSRNIGMTAIAAFMVGFFSAIQDIGIEAYRIELLDKTKLGLGTSISVLGYRLGMLCSGAGAIYLSAYFHSWNFSYNIMAVCMLVGIVTTFYAAETKQTYVYDPSIVAGNWFYNIIIQPLKSFIHNKQWKIILIFILSYKFADIVLNVMSMPFLLEMGFNKVEIAHVAKTFGIIAMLCGGLTGGIAIGYLGLWRMLILATALQFVAACLFILQAQVGHDLSLLFVTMGIENFTCGLAQVALMTYLSRLCIKPYTAVHFAILTSFASFARVNFSMLSGWLADHMSWGCFYSIVCFSCVFSLILLHCCNAHFAMFKRGVSE